MRVTHHITPPFTNPGGSDPDGTFQQHDKIKARGSPVHTIAWFTRSTSVLFFNMARPSWPLTQRTGCTVGASIARHMLAGNLKPNHDISPLVNAYHTQRIPAQFLLFLWQGRTTAMQHGATGTQTSGPAVNSMEGPEAGHCIGSIPADYRARLEVCLVPRSGWWLQDLTLMAI
jgi:hypothetical protein